LPGGGMLHSIVAKQYGDLNHSSKYFFRVQVWTELFKAAWFLCGTLCKNDLSFDFFKINFVVDVLFV
jgi:hypothetical protein